MNKQRSAWQRLIQDHHPLVAFVLAIVLGALAMKVCGYHPLEAYAAILKGAFGGRIEIAQTLIQATPLIFSGLAYLVAVKASMINLGVEGELYMGSLGTALVAICPLPVPGALKALLAILAGIVCGALYGGIVGLMKVRFRSNEVIVTMMLNTIAIKFVDFMVTGPITEPGKSQAWTAKFDKGMWLPKLLPGTQLTIAILLAVAVCVLVRFVFDRTRLGYEIKCAGLNLAASKAAGIHLGSMILISMLISGGIGGLLGSCHVLAVDHRLISGFSPGFGFDGIAVAALAGGDPVKVILSGLVFGALKAGCQALNRTTGIPTEFVDVIQSLIILLVAAPLLVQKILRAQDRAPGRGLRKAGGGQ